MRRVFGGLALVSALALSGCIWDYHEQPVDGDIVLLAIDGADDYSLCQKSNSSSCIGLVDGAVVALGVSERYIAVARLPYDFHGVERPPDGGAATIEYYVVDRNGQGRRPTVLGPFTDGEFREKAETLRLPSLEVP